MTVTTSHDADALAFHTAEALDDDIRRAAGILMRANSTVEEYLTTAAGRAEFVTTLDYQNTINKIGELSVIAAELGANLTRVIVAQTVERVV